MKSGQIADSHNLQLLSFNPTRKTKTLDTAQSRHGGVSCDHAAETMNADRSLQVSCLRRGCTRYFCNVHCQTLFMERKAGREGERWDECKSIIKKTDYSHPVRCGKEDHESVSFGHNCKECSAEDEDYDETQYTIRGDEEEALLLMTRGEEGQALQGFIGDEEDDAMEGVSGTKYEEKGRQHPNTSLPTRTWNRARKV
jgi:hypothetical protein